MKKARVYVHDMAAGILAKLDKTTYLFTYFPDYIGRTHSSTLWMSEI